jgi:hypothetical protein
VAISWSGLKILGITKRDLEGGNYGVGKFRKRRIKMKKLKKTKIMSY